MPRLRRMGSECQNLSFTSTKSCEVVGGAFIDHEEYTDTAVESIRNGLWLKAAVEGWAESDNVAGSSGLGSVARGRSGIRDSDLRTSVRGTVGRGRWAIMIDCEDRMVSASQFATASRPRIWMRSGISAGWEGEAPCRRSFGFDNWEAPHSASETWSSAKL